MRRLLTLIVLVLTLSVQAQDNMTPNPNNNSSQQHMKFMGLKMGGKLSTFVNNLKQKGFTTNTNVSNLTSTVMTGKFAGVNDCTLMVYPNDEGNVYLVGVVFPSLETWGTLYSNYKTIKDMLIQKYGEPYDCVEEFNTSYPPTDDRDRMHQTRMERCKYSTTFSLPEGRIVEAITTASMSCYVLLVYADEAAYATNQESAIDDL